MRGQKRGPNKHFCSFQSITCVKCMNLPEIILQVSLLQRDDYGLCSVREVMQLKFKEYCYVCLTT